MYMSSFKIAKTKRKKNKVEKLMAFCVLGFFVEARKTASSMWVFSFHANDFETNSVSKVQNITRKLFSGL